MQAFRLNNISKMALATQNILPGTWFGVGQIAHILCHLNRLFRPLCDDFQICVLNDGNVLFERVARKMQKEIVIGYKSKDFSQSLQYDTNEEIEAKYEQ